MRRYLPTILYVICLLHEVRATLKPQFHKLLSKDEMRRYLHTDSQDTEYDIVRVPNHRRKRSQLSPQQEFKLSAFGKDFDLRLEPNDDVINDGQLSIERRTADGMLTKEIHLTQGRFYVGHVASDPDSHVAVREVDEKGQLSGAIMSDGHLYQIEPLPDHLHRRATLKGTGYHVISRRSIQDLPNKGKKSTPVGVPEIKRVHDKFQEDQNEPDDTESKRDDVIYQGKIYIEAMLAADKTTCDYYGNGTLDYLLNTANLISRLYKDKSIGMKVSWVLVKVFLVEGIDPDLDFTANNITSGGKYLKSFAKWASKRNMPDKAAEHYDHAAMLTRRVCGLNSCYMDGLAYYSTPCSSKWGVSVNDATGLTAAYTVTHEMGHNIGLPHDRGDCAKGYIMQSVQSSGPNAHHWSSCSRDKLKAIFTSRTCFHNKPPKQLPSPTFLPGYTTDIDKQCQLAYGADYRACPSLRESCGALYCTKGGSCYSRGAPVAEGTACGYRKWCRAGVCTDVGPSLPPPIDGGWGPWGTYGSCSRTCGGGVKYRSRQCNNPAPQYFGKPCQGSARGHFRMCNTQECTTDRYRHEQCEEHNTATTKYRAHYLGGSSKCTLACVTGSKGYFFGHVKDGTRCESNAFVYDVCIEGKCNVVGCNKKLGSRKVYDRCFNCGGDGSSCSLTNGNYTKNYKVYGAYKGDIMFTIPKGATHVEIVEQSKSYNFLGIKSNTTGKYYVPIPAWTATYKAAGTSIYHKMSGYNFAEIISILGPTNEALDAMYAYSGYHNNPGISYSFYAPGSGKSTKFNWKEKNEGKCSATCAGGVQLIKVTCHREDDDTEVTPVYCDKSTKPANSRQCNLAPCPKQFQLGVWSPCSEPCGGGQQHRNLTCVQVVSQDVTNVLPESECAHLSRPVSSQNCNNVDCMAKWIVGNWAQCSVLCDNGTKSRSVECKKKLGDGTWTVVSSDDCDDMPPDSSTSCNEMPCYTWRVEYPCVNCGRQDMTHVPIGCFKDKHQGGRPLPELVGNHRRGINWHQMSETVQKCAQDAWQKQFPVFGVQFYGECWSGPSGYVTYDKDGFNLQGCWEGVGRTRNNYVYAFTSLVTEPLVDCIYTVTNQTVAEDRCTATKPLAKMKLCSHVCPIGYTG
ncbi:A disintegrin and metalloproteinase with thrombospondin motifs 1-like isoform X2 [Oculina patagonica]